MVLLIYRNSDSRISDIKLNFLAPDTVTQFDKPFICKLYGISNQIGDDLPETDRIRINREIRLLVTCLYVKCKVFLTLPDQFLIEETFHLGKQVVEPAVRIDDA